MNYHFDQRELTDFEANIRREWSMTNGLGGYSGTSILGALNRTHQGYLIASYRSPVQRYLVFSRVLEAIAQGDEFYRLDATQYKNLETNATEYVKGNQYLTAFDYDGTVCFTYQAGDVTVEKTIAMVQGENKVVVGYHIQNDGAPATLTLVPAFNFREHSSSSTPESLIFTEEKVDSGLYLFPEASELGRVFIWFSASEGRFEKRTNKVEEWVQLQTEVDNEVDGLDCNYTPYNIVVNIGAGEEKTLSLLCETGIDSDEIVISQEIADPETADYYIDKAKDYYEKLIENAGYEDAFANQLVHASNAFLTERVSTGLTTILAGLPWFTDWGRDTMIAFTGLTLCTKRYKEAAEILESFAKYLHNGMIPNMFPDSGEAPLYNTVDASLWYFYAVDQYLKYVDTEEAYSFVKGTIYPVLAQIIRSYQIGTDFSIYMTDDGLIHAGSGVDQVTWMDVRVGDWVPTPRHGKPVEIQALWYNALCVMEKLSERFGPVPGDTNNKISLSRPAQYYRNLAEQVKENFCRKFWYADGGYLYDVVDGDELYDNSLRPNQLFAVSLPYSMLSAEQEASVVKVVTEKLLAGPGIRSLSPDHKDYHPIYLGALEKRDAAYHQGTAWGFLMGTFLTSFMKVNGHTNAAAKKALEYLEPVKAHMLENCIGSISEIFDGDAPHYGRGCYAQAGSVGAVLRAYVEDVLPYL